MDKKIVIIGASGHGKVLADIAKKNGYSKIVFLDDNDRINSCGNYSIVGKVQDYYKYKDYDFIIGIGNSEIREKFQNRLINENYNIATLIHPNAVIAEVVKIGVGTVVMAGAVINPGTIIGNGVIVNTCSSVDHDCKVKDYSHISVGSHLAGTVIIGENVWIGAGATVVKDLNESGLYIGLPAKKIKEWR